MTAQPAALHTDTNGVETSAEYGDPGDGTAEWYLFSRIANGGDATQGARADAATTDPTTTSSVVSILKGLLTALRVSAAGLLKAEDDAHASGDSGVQVLGVSNAAGTALSGTAGDYTPLSVTAAGELHTTPSTNGTSTATAPTNATTTAYATNLVVKASAGTLFGLSGFNSLASAQWVQIHNAASLPADAAVPAVLIYVEATKPFSIDFGVYGRRFSTGIVVCCSTTGPTKTIGAANLWIDAQYE